MPAVISFKFDQFAGLWNSTLNKGKRFNLYTTPTSETDAYKQEQKYFAYTFSETPDTLSSMTQSSDLSTVIFDNYKECEDGFASWSTTKSSRLLSEGFAISHLISIFGIAAIY